MSLSANAFAQKALPDVSLKTLDGKTVNIKDIAKKGQTTVISFWATWCAPCKQELTAYAPLAESWKKNYNAEFVAVSIDDARGAAKVKPMVAEKGWKFPVYTDATSQMQQHLGFQSIPYLLIINKNGKIVYQHAGYEVGGEKNLEQKLVKLK